MTVGPRRWRGWSRLLLLALLVVPAVGSRPSARSQAPEAIVYTVRVPAPDSQRAVVEARFPTGGQASLELMMPIWSPGFYRVEDYAGRVSDFYARNPDGGVLPVEQPRPNRWRISTGGAPRVTVTYRLVCRQRSVTTNWVSADLGVFNGAATFITLADGIRRPHEVRLERPPTWLRSMSGLEPAPDGRPDHYRAPDYDTLVDSPVVAGDLDVHTFEVDGVPHLLVDAGTREGWDGARAAGDLQRIVAQSLPLWGRIPYTRYVFLNVFRPGGGGLEHANSTLLTVNARRTATPAGYRSWLSFAAHEYFHAFNVKRLRPVELGPFDYEAPPHTSSLWLSEGVTSYYGDLFVTRAGLSTREEFLAALSAQIRSLQNAPGRLLQTLEQSSLGVWENSMSGVGANSSTVSYYVKGQIAGFLLDARIRRLTGGARTFEDVMRLAYRRYGGERGFTPGELRATAGEFAGADLGEWFRSVIGSTGELDYSEALDWFGLSFSADREWELEVRADATPAQREHLQALLVAGVPPERS